jgi:hypothetical protein
MPTKTLRLIASLTTISRLLPAFIGRSFPLQLLATTTDSAFKAKAATRTIQLDNLRRLKAAGVNIIIGQDTYGHDLLHEAHYLHALGLWSNLELLRIWSMATPQNIFPHRRIARFAPGYEVSFIVLRSDPLKDWSATGQIEQRWKQGIRLTP